jgi:predicted transport protein
VAPLPYSGRVIIGALGFICLKISLGLAVFSNNKRFTEGSFPNEEKFELLTKQNAKLLFGDRAVYIDLKNKIEARELGGVIPDGFLFDLNDKNNPEFYLVEVELQRHDFWKHIFPQLTKFFAFYRNPKSTSKLIEQLFDFIRANQSIKKEFEQYLAGKELFKSIKDAVENSQNILLVADDLIPEVEEVQDTYQETWGKYVKPAVLKQYAEGDKEILILDPGFDELREGGSPLPASELQPTQVYDESFHIRDIDPPVGNAYQALKKHMLELDKTIVFNPQHYYISIRKNRNFAFIKPKKKKLQIVIMLPFEVGGAMIQHHTLRQLSLPVQRFYSGRCFEVEVENELNFEEIVATLERAYKDESKIEKPV